MALSEQGQNKLQLYAARCIDGRFLTVEVSLFFYMFGLKLSTPATSEYIYTNICMDRFEDEDICSQLDSDPALKDAQDDIQKTATHWFQIMGIAMTLPGFVTSLILGSWCDKFSWKLPLIMPPLGQFLMYFIMFCVSFHRVSLWFVIFASVIGSLFGGFYSVLMGVFGYASQISTDEQRSMRMGILDGASCLASLLGYLVSGYAVGSSYSVAFLLIASASLLSALHVFLFVKELHTWEEVLRKKAGQSWFMFLFSLQHFVDSCRVAFRRRNGLNRKHLLLATFGFNITVFCYSGYANVLQLFLFSQPLSFNAVELGVYLALGYTMSGFGALVVLYFMKTRLGLSDSIAGIIGISFRMGIFLIISIHAKWAVFCALPLFLFNSYGTIGLRSIISKCVSNNERGQIFAFVGVVEGGFSMLAAVICNAIYADTLSVMPGYIFIWLTFVMAIALIFSIIIQRDVRRQSKLDLSLEVTACNDALPLCD